MRREQRRLVVPRGKFKCLAALSLVVGLVVSFASSFSAPPAAHAEVNPDNFAALPQAYWVIDNLNEYELQIWDSSCGEGNGCYRVINSNSLPDNDGDETWFDSDTTGSYRIRKENGNIEIFTMNQSRNAWETGATNTNAVGDPYYLYDMKSGAPDIIITYKNGAKNVNGVRSDVIVKIDSFSIVSPVNVRNDVSEYRRSLLAVTTSGYWYRDYVLQPRDETCSGTDVWKRGSSSNCGTGNLHNVSRKSSGTWTDTTIQIKDGTADQTFLFTVGDLDNAKDNTGVNSIYGPGSEGIDLGAGFDLTTLTLSSGGTLLDTYGVENGHYVQYSVHTDSSPSRLGNYIVGTKTDSNTDVSRFAVLGAANGASFTWTSGLNCDTNMLDTTISQAMWHPMPAVSMEPTAVKNFIGGSLSETTFSFELVPDSAQSGNLATSHPATSEHPDYAPQGGAGTLDTASGVITFPTMTFQPSNDGLFDPIGTYYYKFYEIKGTDSSIVYDETVHLLKVVVKGADNDIGAQTLGYTLRAYLGHNEQVASAEQAVYDDEPFFTTHSRIEASYAMAQLAATGASSTEFLSHVFEDTNGYTYTYNEDIGKWVRNDGEEGNPPATATSVFDVPYGQARTMVLEGVSGFDDNRLKNTVWVDSNNNVQYKYYSERTMSLTYSQGKRSMGESELQSLTWVDGSDTYTWGNTTGIVPFGRLDNQTAAAVTERTWVDSERNTYVYRPVSGSSIFSSRWIKNDNRTQEEVTETLTWAQLLALTNESIPLSQTWTDPVTGDTYTHSSGEWTKVDTYGNTTHLSSIDDDVQRRMTTSYTYNKWVGQEGEQVVAPPDTAVSDYVARYNTWLKNGDVVVYEPTDTSESTFTFRDSWFKETRTSDGSSGTLIERVTSPVATATAPFTLSYADSAYALEDGVVKEDIQALTWTDKAGNTYTYDENRGWLRNGSTPVSEPPSTATAVFWEGDANVTANSGAEFNNRRVHSLTVEKNLAGRWASPTDEFDFNVSLPALAGQSIQVVLMTAASGSTPASAQTVTADFDSAGEWTFTLRGGQSITIPGITSRTPYSVSEDAVVTYTASAQVTDGDTTGMTNTVGTTEPGVVSDTSLEADTTVTFTNTKREHDLSVSKTVVGDLGDETIDFEFVLKVPDLASATLKDSTGNDIVFSDDGTYTFTLKHGQSLSIVGLPEGAQYTVEESAESAEGYTTSVDGGSGRLISATLMDDTTHEFENARYMPPATLLSEVVSGVWFWLAVCGIVGAVIAWRMRTKYLARG